MASNAKSTFRTIIVFLLAIFVAIIGYCVYDYINVNIFGGVYPLGKFVALTAGFLPIMIADIIKNKKITSFIFPIICIAAVFAWFYFTLPDMSQERAFEELSSRYDKVLTASETFDDEDITDEKIPSYYAGAYLFEATKDSVAYYVVMNPKDGETYEYEAEKNELMAKYFKQ